MSFLRNMRITHKLSMILIIVLLGFAAIGITYKYILDINTQSIQTSEQLSEFGAYIERVHVDLLDARRIEKDFAINTEIGLVEQFELKMTAARENLAKLEALAPTNMDQTALINIQDLFRRYHSDFYGIAESQVKLGLDETTGLQGTMRNASHDLETRLKKLGDTALIASLLQMRRHEKDYLLRGNDKDITKLDKEHRLFSSQLNKSKHSSGIKASISNQLNAYYKAFQQYANTAQEKNLTTVATQNTVNQLEPLFNNLLIAKDKILSQNKETSTTQQQNITGVFAIILLVTGVLVSIVLLLFSRGIIRSLGKLRDTVDKVAAGDFNVRAQLNTKDELGTLGTAFDTLLDERLATLAQAEKENEQLNDSIIMLLEAVSQLSEKDLSIKAKVNEDITGPVADAMNLMTDETAQVLNGIRRVSDDVEFVVNLVKQQSEKVTHVAASEREVVETAMIKLETASRTMNEVSKLAQSCNEIATRASASTTTAFDTVTDTADGMNDIRETISETEKRIKRLGERSQEITTVVDIIKDIAERTHGLALNASMQAAAAGDAGRGFAVVADEVQRLAESSRNSTAQITSLVRSIQSETSETMATMNKAISQVIEGSSLAERAGKEMQETQKTTSELVQAVIQIAEQSLAQVVVHDDLKNDTTAIRNSTNDTGRELEEQSKHTSKLVDYAKLLKDSVHVFKLPESMQIKDNVEPIPLRQNQNAS
ncbi:MAG: methyl-accepting chemotaxis protein [Gammaproteobacteria bacterium]